MTSPVRPGDAAAAIEMLKEAYWEELLSYIEQLERQQQWQDINTAPAQGFILRWNKIHGCAVSVRRLTLQDKKLLEVAEGIEWIVGTLDHCWPEESFTPHWRPLPAAPQEVAASGPRGK